VGEGAGRCCRGGRGCEKVLQRCESAKRCREGARRCREVGAGGDRSVAAPECKKFVVGRVVGANSAEREWECECKRRLNKW
jgi:hypothetical protein